MFERLYNQLSAIHTIYGLNQRGLNLLRYMWARRRRQR